MIIIVALVTYRVLDEWMMAASKQGEYVSWQFIKMGGADIVCATMQASSMLREAIEHSDYVKVAQLIDKGVNLHTCIDSVSKLGSSLHTCSNYFS